MFMFYKVLVLRVLKIMESRLLSERVLLAVGSQRALGLSRLPVPEWQVDKGAVRELGQEWTRPSMLVKATFCQVPDRLRMPVHTLTSCHTFLDFHLMTQ